MIFGFIAKIYRKYQEYIHPGIYVTRHGILYREKIADIMYIRYKD